MTWADFYLLCFVVGFALSLVSFLGAMHWHLPFHIHLPWNGGHFHGGGFGPTGSAHPGAGAGASSVPTLSPFNFFTITVFLAWFGGTGYLLTRYSKLWVGFGLSIAVLVGLSGAIAIFLFVGKLLMSEDDVLDPEDYRMEGVLGRVIMPIREGGTGEIVFSQAGGRRNASARSDEGAAIEKGVEVIVTRYEKGIAYVRRWQDMAGEESSDPNNESGTTQ